MLSTKHPAAPLTRGLPYAFRTPDGHFVPDHIRQSPNGLPAQTRLQKTFYRKDVDNITAEVDEVNSFGDGAADEWRKGMTQRGKDAMADSSRWERWEGTMPLGKMPAEVLREYDLASFPRLLDQQQRQQREATSQYAHVGGALAAPPFHGKQESFSNLNFFIPVPHIVKRHTLSGSSAATSRKESKCNSQVDDCYTQSIDSVTDPSHRYSSVTSACACLCKHTTSIATSCSTSRTFYSPCTPPCPQCSRG